jgi:hypothetical protein
VLLFPYFLVVISGTDLYTCTCIIRAYDDGNTAANGAKMSENDKIEVILKWFRDLTASYLCETARQG